MAEKYYNLTQRKLESKRVKRKLKKIVVRMAKIAKE